MILSEGWYLGLICFFSTIADLRPSRILFAMAVPSILVAAMAPEVIFEMASEVAGFENESEDEGENSGLLELEKALIALSDLPKTVWLERRDAAGDVDVVGCIRCNVRGRKSDAGEMLRPELLTLKLEADKALVDRGSPGRAN